MSKEQGAVLIGAPTYAGKMYCIDEWIAGCRSQRYEPKFIYTVDNTSAGEQYYKLLQEKGIDCTHLTPWPDWDRTFKRSWELILSRAQAKDCYWVYSVESDNIPDPDSLQILINMALYGNLHLLMHSYPMHATAAKASGLDPEEFMYHEMGCMLMSRRLLERSLEEFDTYGNIAWAIQATCTKYEGGSAILTNKFRVLHLDGYEMAYQNLASSSVKGLICPTPKMPEDFGSVTPPCLQEAKT